MQFLQLLAAVAASLAVVVADPDFVPTDTLVSRDLYEESGLHARGLIKPQKLYNLTLFHVNDVHSHLDTFRSSGTNCTNPAVGCFGGYPAIKATIDRLRPKKKNSLFLNLGDEFQGTMYFQYYGGEKIAETINQLGFDAFVLGNHEFDRGDAHLAQFLKNLTFPTICANVKTNNTALAKQLVPYRIFPEHQLAIVAVTVNAASLSSPGPGTTFQDPVTTIQAVVNKVRRNKQVKRVIAMTHIGYDVDIKLAQQTRGIDLIVGGHSHSLLGNFTGAVGPYPTIAKNLDGEEVFIVTSYRWGEYLGYLQVSYNEKNKIVAYEGAPIHLTNTTAEDPKLKAQVRQWAEPFLEFSNRVVGSTTVTLDQTACQSGECLMGDVMADAMQWYRTGTTEGGLINAGGVRASINAGDITVGDVLTTFPFSNAVVDLTFTASELWRIFEGIGSRTNQFNGNPVTSFVQVSKEFKVVFDSAAAVGSRLKSLTIGDRAVTADGTDTFVIATVDFLGTGGDNFWPAKSGFITLQTLDEVLMSYLGQSGPISPALDGRIQIQ